MAGLLVRIISGKFSAPKISRKKQCEESIAEAIVSQTFISSVC